MNAMAVLVLAVIAALIVFAIGFGFLITRLYKKVDQGKALIVNKTKTNEVYFTGGWVIPFIHRAEVMDTSVKTIEIDRRGNDGLICMDNIRADITVTFFVRVNKTKDDVLQVAQMIGCDRASHQGTLEELFNAKFSEALKTVGKRLDFVDLYKERDHFKDQIIGVIGKDLNGYALEDAAIDYLEQTPLASLDKDNILDAQGIKKITQLTTQQNILTNDLRQQERKQIKKQDVEAEEAVLDLQRQQADAEAKQEREIAVVRARESAETRRVQAEEHAKSENARLKAEEEVSIRNENKERQVQVAMKNRERVVAIENERVEKDRMLEQIDRERETELQRIAKEKALEVEKKHIADVVRARIAVDKTVAEEEERIKTLRVVEEASRQKDAVVIAAEATAQDGLVMATKAAEAQEQVAKFKAKEVLILAEADLEAADKKAKSKIRLAEGQQAEQAASGLADAKVREATALAHEKEGLAEVRVKEADADASEKQGRAAAIVLEQKGLADVRIKEADAAAIEKVGEAEATAVKLKLTAEAAGLADKATAMKALDGVGREHEEFRIKLEKEKDVEMRSIEAKVEVAKEQAKILSEAFGNAKINIVGGDGQFFDRFIKAVSVGQSIDGTIDHSETLQTALSEYLQDGRSLPADMRDVLTRPALSAGDIQSLSVAGVLGKLSAGADPAMKNKLQALAKHAQELGIDIDG